MFTRLGTVSRRIGLVTKNSLAFVGLGTTIYGLRQYKEYKDATSAKTLGSSSSGGISSYFNNSTWKDDKKGKNKDDKGEKEQKDNDSNENKSIEKKVLVLPFHRMKIVERKKGSKIKLQDLILNSNNPDDDRILEVELQHLIHVIHEAAKDPEIVALYGTFGNGFRFECGGYSHVEEIRNAVRVFNESHRRHYERSTALGKNGNGDGKDKPEQKFSYAFADTFDHPVDSGNKEYFLASAFSDIIMQKRGNLNLFGVSTSNTFVLGALEKYGVKAHVFKHGKYKNAPNILTEYGYTKAHLENTKSIIESINQSIFSSITHSRNLNTKFNQKVWQAVHDYGTLTAPNAQEVDLIDHTSHIDPLSELVLLNNHKDNDNYEGKEDSTGEKKISKDRLEYLKKRWGYLLVGSDETSNNSERPFIANKMESFQEYSSTLSMRKKWLRRKYEMNRILSKAAEKSIATESILSFMGLKAPYFNIGENEYDAQYNKKSNEKIAVVHINGGIDDQLARNVVKTLRKIKYDDNTKAIIFRVDSPGGSVTASEIILEECKDMQKPVICSFSNVAASGGYYVSAFSDRIFALPTTLTGSIGVFGIKFDVTELARSYGVDVNFVSSGHHSSAYSLFRPLTKQMKTNFERNINNFYSYFKEIVSEGRNIPIVEVEEIARGRVWTGEQAKEVGLVDEIGGIERAILYAKKKYATDCAQVEVWPKPLSLKDRLLRFSEAEAQMLVSEEPSNKFMDGSNITQLLLNKKMDPSSLTKLSLSSGLLLTIDETTAIAHLLKEGLEKDS